MTDREPIETTNLDRYGSPDGRPRAAGIGAVWSHGDLYFTSGPETRKARNLAARPACTISVRLKGIDLVRAHRPQAPHSRAFRRPRQGPRRLDL